jgi:gonadotropin-releasing hormone receptor
VKKFFFQKITEGVNGEGLRRSGAGVLNRARARTLKMTIVIVLVFIFCWTPYYIIVLW